MHTKNHQALLKEMKQGTDGRYPMFMDEKT